MTTFRTQPAVSIRPSASDELERLGHKLRELRKARRYSSARVAQFTTMSQSTISRIETGDCIPTLDQIEEILKVIRADADARRQVRELARRTPNIAHQDVDWLVANHADDINTAIGRIEAAASHVTELNGVVISGLLQTAEYAAAVIGQHPQEDPDHSLQARLARQSLLNTPGKHITAIQTETSLRNRWVAADAMLRQYHHLVSLSTLPNVDLGIVPMKAVIDFVPQTSLLIFDDDYATVDTSVGVCGTANHDDVSYYRSQVKRAKNLAVWGDEARALLCDLSTELQHDSEPE